MKFLKTATKSGTLQNSMALVLMALWATGFGQQWGGSADQNGNIYRTGSVGIGTTNPDRKLTIKSGLAQSSSGENACNFDMYVSYWTEGSGPRIDFTHQLTTKLAAIRSYIFGQANTGLAFETGWDINSAVNMVIDGSGKVGIGTTTPDRKLTVRSGLAQSSSGENACNFDMYVANWTEGSGPRIDFTHQLTTKLAAIRSYIFGQANTGLAFETGWSTNSAVNMVITGDGHVGIGTLNPSNAKLVIGKCAPGSNAVYLDSGDLVIAKGKVKIRNWSLKAPDYVFDKSYSLPKLSEVEKYVKSNKHLPGIESGSQMKKNGIDLTEMNLKLLKQVEHLTLYAIEQNKELMEQKKEIAELRAKIR